MLPITEWRGIPGINIPKTLYHYFKTIFHQLVIFSKIIIIRVCAEYRRVLSADPIRSRRFDAPHGTSCLFGQRASQLNSSSRGNTFLPREYLFSEKYLCILINFNITLWNHFSFLSFYQKRVFLIGLYRYVNINLLKVFLESQFI